MGQAGKLREQSGNRHPWWRVSDPWTNKGKLEDGAGASPGGRNWKEGLPN